MVKCRPVTKQLKIKPCIHSSNYFFALFLIVLGVAILDVMTLFLTVHILKTLTRQSIIKGTNFIGLCKGICSCVQRVRCSYESFEILSNGAKRG